MRCALNVRSKSAYCASSPRSPVDRRTRAPARLVIPSFGAFKKLFPQASRAASAAGCRISPGALDPAADLRGSVEYKRHLAEVLTQRALEKIR